VKRSRKIKQGAKVKKRRVGLGWGRLGWGGVG